MDGQSEKEKKINEVERVMETKAIGAKHSLPMSGASFKKQDY